MMLYLKRKFLGHKYEVAAAVAAAGIGSAAIGAVASNSAAGTQSSAANNASQMQWNEFQTAQQNEQPYMQLGEGAINPYMTALGYTMNGLGNVTGTNPNNPLQTQFNPQNYGVSQNFSFNPSDLQNYPGYQFTLQQGMMGVNNSDAARGLGMSSANMKDAANYATGLAQTTYGTAYNQALQSYDTNYGNALNTYSTNYNTAANNANRLGGLVSMGQNAATTVGNQGLQTAANSGNLLTSGAAASAAGTVGAANAVNSGISTALQGYQSSQLLQALQGGSSGNGYGFVGGYSPNALMYGTSIG